MDSALYDEIFGEPKWHRTVDFIAILIIGLLMGATITYALGMYVADTTIVPSSGNTILPNGIKIEQV